MSDVNKRLESLDILRGFDLFCLLVLETILHPLATPLNSTCFDRFIWGFTHVEWEGFSTWDLVMPLFLFMSGITIPFSLSKAKSLHGTKSAVYVRLFKRFVVLWIFGMICQGNLLALDISRIYLYSNTLQSIAIGYLISAILFLNTNIFTQIIVAVALLLTYWVAMTFVSIDGFGGGAYAPQTNLAEYIDRVVLGRFRDGATIDGGNVVFAAWNNYTWILSSLNFIVTVMSGVFAGYILKSARQKIKKFYLLLFIGIGLILLGYLWGFSHPIIKRIWTSSMTLLSSGLCFILMAMFYIWIDLWGHKRNNTWLKVYGMNSILGYMLTCTVNFSSVSESLLFGIEKYVGDYYPFVISLSNVGIIFAILLVLYRRGIFFKV